MAIHIEEYFEQLPATHQRRCRQLLPALLAVVSAWRSDVARKADSQLVGIDEWVFTPSGAHPVYDDMPQVFGVAFEQLAQRAPRLPEEIPLLFIGYHSMNRATRSRQSLGFLLTDQTLYVQDQVSVFFEQPLPQYEALPTDPAAVLHCLASQFGRFGWEEGMVNPPQRQELLSVMAAAVQAVLAHHDVFNSFAEPVKEAPSFDGLLRSLALVREVKDGRKPEHAKELEKVASKFQIPADEKILFAISVKPLFGGPYGFAVTRAALYSRDLMEAPQAIPFAELFAEGGLRPTDDKKNLVTSSGQIIFLPVHLGAAAVKQVGTLLRGSVELIRAGVMTG